MGSESSRNANDKDGISRIPAFYKMSVRDRVRAVHERGLLTEEDYRSLASGEHVLKVGTADKMIENVIGIMALLAKRVDDEVVVHTGDKTMTMTVVSILYEQLSAD